MRQDSRFIKDIWVQEVPSGTVDGLNAVFTLSVVPKQDACVMLFANGLLVSQGAGATEYTIVSDTITFGTAPVVSTVINTVYIRASGGV